MRSIIYRRFNWLLLLLAMLGIATGDLTVAQTPLPPKKKYPVTIVVSSSSGSEGRGLYSLSVLGKSTSLLQPPDAEGRYPNPYLLLTLDLEDGVKTPVNISADNAEYIEARIPCADAYVTIEGNLDSFTERGGTFLDLFVGSYNNYDFNNNLPISITVRSVKPTATGGPQVPPSH